MSRLSRFVGKTRHGQPQPAWRMPSIAIAVGIAAVAGFAGLAAQSKAKVKALPVPDSSNYSLSTQITKANVGQLEMAWFYPYGAPTFSPVFANDVLYGLGRNASALIALDPATGKEIWVHEGLNGITSKGINYWESADGKDRRLIFAVDSFLQEIDARTGKTIPAFGENGIVRHASRPAACRGHEHPRDAGQPGPDLAQHHDLWRPVGRVDHDAARRHPRLRRAHRQAALAVPHDPAPGRVRVRDQPARRLQVHGRREQLGRDVDRRGARNRLHPDGVSHGRLLRRRSRRPEPVRELPARSRRANGQAPLAFPDRPPRPLGSRQRLRAAARDGDARRPEGRRRRPRRQDRIPLRVRARHRAAAVADRGASGGQERGAVRAVVAHAAVPDEARGVRAAVVHGR